MRRHIAVSCALVLGALALSGCEHTVGEPPTAPLHSQALPRLTLPKLPPVEFAVNADGTVLADIPSDYYFAFGSALLSPNAAQGLRALLDAIQNFGSQYSGPIEIRGYTDGIGSEQYNRLLSRARAQAVAAWLIAKGIPISKIEVVGEGELGARPNVADASKRHVTVELTR